MCWAEPGSVQIRLKSRKNKMKFRIIAVMFLAVAATGSAAGEGADLSVVNRIKDQAFNHSQVMNYMHHLADENGPRLAASPAYQRAAR